MEARNLLPSEVGRDERMIGVILNAWSEQL
jgi:hypothetical protein